MKNLLSLRKFSFFHFPIIKYFCIFAPKILEKMRKLLLVIGLLLSAMVTQAQLRNPVIPGYHPDPSVCRVGDDFYLVNSSFQYFPGVPIYHSRDLVNWELIGNVLDRESQLPLKDATSWLGIYAPTIRYHEGTYYMITTNVGNRGNFMVTATDPRGPWSEPIWLEQQGIDPSLWFEDGRCYMMSNPDNTILLCEIDPKTGRQLTPSKPLWQGTGGRWPEGPHIYKKDGWYYLLISEGGTELAHKLTIARSRHIYGPYKANPANPILTNCSRDGQGKQIQGTGHGDLIQATDGSWWIVFLAYRNFGGSYHPLGRETCLAPVKWEKGQWPVVNGGQPIDTLMQVATLPQVPVQPKASYYDFSMPFGPEWIYIQNPVAENYLKVNGRLRLKGGRSSLTANERPTFIGRRQESAAMLVETHLNFSESAIGDEAGLTVYQINDGHTDFCLQGMKGKMVVAVKTQLKTVAATLFSEEIDGFEASLRVTSDGEMYRFEYSLDGQHYKPCYEMACSLMSTEVVGGFTGVVLGMYCSQKGSDGATFADFDYFKYEEK